MIKLLDKSFKLFLGYAAIVLACSIPAYYVMVDLVWEHELKEHNRIVSAGIRHHLKTLRPGDTLFKESIGLWNKLQPDKQLIPVDRLRKDSSYNIYRANEYIPSKKTDRFQGLVTYFEWNGQPYRLTVETNMEESQETLLWLAVVSLVFFMLLMGGLILLNRRLSARIWRPFYSGLHKIQDFDLGSQQSVLFEKTNILEFEALNNSLDKLITNNIAIFRQQKHFIENASHELQTPLAVVQSKLDLFLQNNALTDQQSGIIEQAQMALSRVNRINKNLLLLARIENSQFPEREAVNLSALVDAGIELIGSYIAEKELELVLDIVSDVKVDANKVLVEILLSNLLLNAVRYSPEQGTVRLTLTPDELLVANTGSVTLIREQLFKRFGRASSQAPVTGLGLAIVQQISQQYHWEVFYDFTAAQHCFTLRFR